MSCYNVGDCFVCKTGVIKILGKFSKKVYKVIKYSKDFLSFNVGSYNAYQISKFFVKCEPDVVYKADKLLQINWNLVKNTINSSKATKRTRCSVVMNPRGYILQIRVKSGWWMHTNVNYERHYTGCHTYSWEHWDSTPIYLKEYKALNNYLLTLKNTLAGLWQNIRILSE